MKDKFYKECGQWCNDPHDQIADWWINEIKQERTYIRNILKEWKEKGFEVDTLIDRLSVLEWEDLLDNKG